MNAHDADNDYSWLSLSGKDYHHLGIICHTDGYPPFWRIGMSARVNLSQAIIWFFRTAMLTVFPPGSTTNDKTLWTVKAFLPYGRTLKTGMQDVFFDNVSLPEFHSLHCPEQHALPYNTNEAVILKRPPKVGQVKHYPVIERVRYCTGLFPFNRDLILLLL